MNNRSLPQLRIALLLGAAATLATLALLPYLLAVQPDLFEKVPVAIPVAVVIAVQTLQNGVLCFLLAWAGLKLGEPLGLGAPWLAAWLYKDRAKPAASSWMLAALLGVLGGALVLGAIALFGQPIAASASPPHEAAAWQGALASFYGGIVEETQIRLFLMTLLGWLLLRARLRQSLALGIAIVAAAVLFGAGHLPLAAKLGPLDTLTIVRVIGYNALLAVLFGWLYWKRGIEHAMLSHFSADLVLHVIAPLAHSFGMPA